MFFGKRVPFPHFFEIFALSFGASLLAAWVPYFIFLTEPWKWRLTGLELMKVCNLKWFQAVIIIGITIMVIIFFFWSLNPIMALFR